MIDWFKRRIRATPEAINSEGCHGIHKLHDEV